MEKIKTPTPKEVLAEYPKLIKVKHDHGYLEFVKQLQQRTIQLKEVWEDEFARGIKRYKSE
jgi:hypothetical protein